MFTYLGDVNYFLEKRAMEDLRQVAMYKSTDKAQSERETVVSKTPALNPEEKKAQQKRVQNIEKKIFILEQEIAKIESLLAQEDFYQSSDYPQQSAKYRSLKEELSSAEQEWESMVDNIEA
jgi:ATP-binding cassette subfamily F protein 3